MKERVLFCTQKLFNYSNKQERISCTINNVEKARKSYSYYLLHPNSCNSNWKLAGYDAVKGKPEFIFFQFPWILEFHILHSAAWCCFFFVNIWSFADEEFSNYQVKIFKALWRDISLFLFLVLMSNTFLMIISILSKIPFTAAQWRAVSPSLSQDVVSAPFFLE